MTAPSAKEPLAFPSWREFRWPALFALIVMALTCLPYVYGLLSKPSGDYYSGLLTNPDEHNVYLAYMKETSEGRLFLIDPFTSEPQAGRVFNLLFLLLGFKSRATGLALPAVYQATRLISGWLLLMAIYCLAAQLLPRLFDRRLALVLAALASGLGWLYPALPGSPHPIDFGPGLTMPEAITFLSLLLNPLFCFSMFLMVAAIGLGAHAVSSGSWRSTILAGLAALFLANIHTYDLLPVSAALALYTLWLLAARRTSVRAAARALVIIAIASPALAYQLWLIKSGEVTLAVKTTETPVHSPSFLMLALGLGIPLALAAVGLVRAFRTRAPAALLLAFWLLAGLALIYAPVPFQRKLAQGIQIPAVLLAVYALSPLLLRLPRHALPLAALLVLVTLPSNVLYLARAITDLRTNNRAYLANLMPPLYLRADQYAAMQWLDANADFGDVLLCNSFLGSYAPSLAGTRVYIGHWAETLHFRTKLTDFARFLRADTPDASRQAFVSEQGITYVLRDRSIYDEIFTLAPDGTPLPAFDPDRAPWLEEVFSQGDVSVYHVKRP
jgi:hypothetical protein